ncbi:HEPN domain-containing protein [Chromobacterium amazonense]|uniref:HEPN domain-containing protein n=1 Tax=Chromobacterium amazonense TaxID=1382803 RepID=A0ABU8UWZ9_9NEIS|nr:HEPN domain-containing protein [Chromobacterium amazonense]MDQ4540893.1 HEPN domain-containing protein [Chromobacterium amazonense]
MKSEFLILIPDDEAFCSSKSAFVDFLKIDALISVTGQKITYRKSQKSRESVTARFRVETNKVKSKQERYFLLALEVDDENRIDEFSELCDRIKSIAERISPGSTAVNTLWDGVGRLYAEKSYPIINEVENLMRKLITKFMLITVGMNWSKDAINPELFKKIEKFEDEEPYLNDLYKLDFIHLSHVLFEKKRDISIEELDRLLAKTSFSEEEKEKILKYIPRSNWEKYFSSLIEEKDHSLEKKWELLYKLRNKVAHNRNVKKSEFEQIRGLAGEIKEIIGKATAKLGEIDLNEEDRELIIYSYQSDSPAAIGFLSEKAVAEYYIRSGHQVSSNTPALSLRRRFDFIASKDAQTIGVEVIFIRARHFIPRIKMTVERQLKSWHQDHELDNLTKIHLVHVIREDDLDYPLSRLYKYADDLLEVLGEKFEIHFGRLNEENNYVPFEK